MTDLLHKFSEAAKILSCGKNPMWGCVKKAYTDYLQDIPRETLPEVLQIFYDSIKLRVSFAEALGHIDNDEAIYIAQDILYIADGLRSQLTKPKEIKLAELALLGLEASK
jgi:hypothetical protein